MFKRRIDLEEFGDRSWLTGWLREAYRDGLHAAFTLGGQYRAMHGPFGEWAASAGGSPVLELAAGGAGPTETLLRTAATHGLSLPTLVLSDLCPERETYEILRRTYGASRVDFMAEPMSATSVPGARYPFQYICSAFHHFSRADAESIIRNCIANGGGLFIMEPFQRDLRHLLMMILSGPFPYMLAPLFARRRTWLKTLFTSFIPLVSLMLMMDGCISILRLHTPGEIEAMIPVEDRKRLVIRRGACRFMKFFQAPFVAITVRSSA